MFRLSRAGLAERWPLFIGAALTVCLGVALVQSSLLLLISAATADAPAGQPAADPEAAVALLGVMLGFSAFLAIFIISSTFGFTVAQRRRDLALLRLVGASRRQVRRLLLGEAVLLGGFGAVTGIPAGLGVLVIQTRMLHRFGFVPPQFEPQWRDWIVGASIGTGLTLALAGALVAARRAGRVQPLEALLDSGAAARVMTLGRWLAGLFFAAGATAMIIVSGHAGPDGGQALAMNVPMATAVAGAALAPLLIPVVARLLPAGGVLGGLARANLRDGKRRSASVAAPVIVLTAIVFGQLAAGRSFAAAGIDEQRRATAADLVVEAAKPFTVRLPGVAAASVETSLPAQVTTGSGEDSETETVDALVVDPADYVRAHPGSGSLAALTGRAVARGPGGDGVPEKGSVRLRVAGTDLDGVPVVARTPVGIGGGASLLLPAGLVPADVLRDAPTRAFVTLKPGADAAATRAELAKLGQVAGIEEWLAADGAARTKTNDDIFLIVVGLGALYALLGVINSVVIGAAARPREFAAARAAGLTRGQVLRAALLESAAVTVAGLLLGTLAAGGTFVSVLAVTSAVTGHSTLDLPWGPMVLVALGALLVTSLTSVLTSWSATRAAPIKLLAARE